MAYINAARVMHVTVTGPQVEGLKQTVTGNPAVLDYVHPTEHVMDVRLENRNLFDIGTVEDYFQYNFEGGTPIDLVVEGNVLSGLARSSASSYILNTKMQYPPGSYVISAKFSDKAVPRFIVRCFDGEGNIMTSDDIVITSGTYNTYYQGWFNTNNSLPWAFSIPDTVAYWCIGFVFHYEDSAYVGTTAAVSDIQLEPGTEATPYTPHIVDFSGVTVTRDNGTLSHVAQYPVNADGTVPGVCSVSPVTILTADSDAVTITAGYYVDAKSKIADLEAALAAYAE